MATLSISHVSIKGIAACVPGLVNENSALPVFGENGPDGFIKSTGIERRHIATEDICTSDLCFNAAEQLLNELNWSKDSIDCLIYVTQTPDYILPATSCVLQKRLGISTDCYTLDISLGCSGWVYGMSVIGSLLNSGTMKRGLLFAGDTISKLCSSKDKSTYPLFGDAGTVTALEYSSAENEVFHFLLNVNGGGADAIIVPEGGYRKPVSMKSFEEQEHSQGGTSNRLQLNLEGMDVFSFGISKAPESVSRLITEFNLDKDSIDYFVFHQANLFMNEKIRKKLKLLENKVPYSLKDYGNTSSATIPLTMVTQLQESLRKEKLSFIGCGFGVGLSWGSISFITDHIVCPDLITI